MIIIAIKHEEDASVTNDMWVQMIVYPLKALIKILKLIYSFIFLLFFIKTA